MNIAERFKKRANLAAVLSVPFIHSGLFRQYAEELGVSVDELSDEQRKEAVKKLSAITLKINRIPRQEMTKVISSASVEAKADAATCRATGLCRRKRIIQPRIFRRLQPRIN